MLRLMTGSPLVEVMLVGVLTGSDQVANTGPVAVTETDAVCLDPPKAHQFGSDMRRNLGGASSLVPTTTTDGLAPKVAGHGPASRHLDHLGAAAFMDAASAVVFGEYLGITGPQTAWRPPAPRPG